MKQPALFLDRDGTLVHPSHYPSRPEQLRLYDGIGTELRLLQSMDLHMEGLSTLPSTAVECVRHFRHLRVLVIGDAMLDTYLEGTASRLCREGPVPVVRKTGEHRLPGGAANTAANLRRLGAEVFFLSIIGRDIAGTALRSDAGSSPVGRP